MKKALVCLVLSIAMLATTVAEARYYKKGGFTITSHRSGQSYRAYFVRYMAGRGPRNAWFYPVAGHYDTQGNAIIDTWGSLSRVSYLGQWAGGPRGTVVTDWRRRGENFVYVYADSAHWALVNNLEFY